MKSEWTRVPLSRVAEVQTGPFGSQLHNKDYVTEGTPIVTVEHLGSRSFTTQNLPCVSEEDRSRLAKYSLNTGDIVFSRVGSVDRCSYVNEANAGWLFSGRCLRVRSTNIHPEFLYYFFCQEQVKEYVKSIAVGATMPSINTKLLNDVEVILPPLPIQRKIASILSALDDKIATNNAICRNLEEQAEAIFSQYYQKENEPRLFTSLIQISGGGTPKTSEPSFWNGNIPFFTPKDAESPFAFTTEKTLTEEGLNNCSSILYPEWTTFITARGTVGKISLAGRAMAMNQSCYALISEEIHPLLIYFYALVVVKSLKQKASGAVFDAIVTRDFDREEIKLLKKDEQQLLLMRIEPIYTQIRSLKLENLKLAETRSALISKLMSGELPIDAIN